MIRSKIADHLGDVVPSASANSTVEGCTKHRWLRNDGIRHGHGALLRISDQRRFDALLAMLERGEFRL
jgi:hypothetical protein